jgi:hypothetical protein
VCKFSLFTVSNFTYRGLPSLWLRGHKSSEVVVADSDQDLVQCSAVQCSAVQCSAVVVADGDQDLKEGEVGDSQPVARPEGHGLCSAVQCSAVQCSAVQCIISLQNPGDLAVSNRLGGEHFQYRPGAVWI